MGICVKDLKSVAETVLRCDLEKGSDHVRYTLRVNGRAIGSFKYSHSWRASTQIHETILHKQAQSMQCSLKTWKLLIQGRITKKTYFEELLEKNLIDQSEFELLCK